MIQLARLRIWISGPGFWWTSWTLTRQSALMKILVTAGPTFENLDRVRRLTNFSTGTLGSELAASLVRQGHEVILLLGHSSIHQAQAPRDAAIIERFSTTADLMDRLRAHASRDVRALFHAAAVCDFRVGSVCRRGSQGELEPASAGKFDTSEGSLWIELVPTPKIIERLRDWFPQACLVGWKYEVDGNLDSAQAKAREQIQRCHTNACVLNGPAYGPGFAWVPAQGDIQHLPDKPRLVSFLARQITQ